MKSINFEYNCPECKEKLLHVENKLHCNNCLCDYEHKNDCTIFKNQNLSYASDNNQSIKEIWHGEPLKKLRDAQINGRYRDIDICKKCYILCH